LGLINDKWASRLLKGREVIDSYVYKDEDVEGGFPNQNLIVGWVLRTVAIPNINPHQVMKTTQALVKQAIKRKEEKRAVAPLSETKEVKLEKVPENELRRPQVQGWVKSESDKTLEELDDERRQAFKERMAAKKADEQASSSTTTTIHTKRQLPSIPKQEEAGKVPEVSAHSNFCPHCGKDLDWKFCPYCGKPLPHE
jgi:hypothetical protein